jgi:hypothetical protein
MLAAVQRGDDQSAARRQRPRHTCHGPEELGHRGRDSGRVAERRPPGQQQLRQSAVDSQMHTLGHVRVHGKGRRQGRPGPFGVRSLRVPVDAVQLQDDGCGRLLVPDRQRVVQMDDDRVREPGDGCPAQFPEGLVQVHPAGDPPSRHVEIPQSVGLRPGAVWHRVLGGFRLRSIAFRNTSLGVGGGRGGRALFGLPGRAPGAAAVGRR